MDTTLEKKDLSVSMAEANVYSLFTSFPPAILLSLGYAAVWGLDPLVDAFQAPSYEYFVFFLACFVGIVVHEGIHGLTWAVVGRKPRHAISFGFQWKTLTPYAHCKEAMDVAAYRVSAAMPGIVLGLLPALVAIATGSAWMLLFGALFTLAAGGDFLILWLLRAVEPGSLVEDHPTRAGCYVMKQAPV